MPATTESLRLAEEASTLVATAPRLMAAEDETHRNAIARDIAGQAQILSLRIERLRNLDSQNDEIEVARAAMVERLGALNQAVTERIKISTQRRALTLAVRRDHENLLEAITPAIDDANFDLMTKGRISEGNATTIQSIDLLRRLLEIQSGANLLVGLLIESSMVTDIASLPPLRDLIAAAERSIEANLRALPDSDQRTKITDRYQRLAAMANEDGIMATRMNELDIGSKIHSRWFSAALAEAARLGIARDNVIERQGNFAQTLSAPRSRKFGSAVCFSSAEPGGAGGRRFDCLALCRAQHCRPLDDAERRDAQYRRRQI